MKTCCLSAKSLAKCGWFLLLLCGPLTACAPMVRLDGGATNGVVAYRYYLGEMTVVFQAGFMETWDGAIIALREMELPIEKSKHDLTKGKIVGAHPDSKTVTLSLQYKTNTETEVVIKVGRLGDKEASAEITEEIRKVLFKG